MSNPWQQRRILAYAHQGGAKEAPSSTLFAIERALALGASGIELDVHATSEGELVVCHDPTLDRMTNGFGEIPAHTARELRDLDNAYYFSPGYQAIAGLEDAAYPYRGKAPKDHRFGVASLEEVLSSFPDTILNLDIKRTAPTVVPYEAALADALRAHHCQDDVIVASFFDQATDAFRALAPEIGTSLGLNAMTAFVKSVRSGEPLEWDLTGHVALQAPLRFGGELLVDEAFVKAGHALGLAVHVWTVDETEDMEFLVDIGVDGIMTDVPSVLVDLLNQLGAHAPKSAR